MPIMQNLGQTILSEESPMVTSPETKIVDVSQAVPKTETVDVSQAVPETKTVNVSKALPTYIDPPDWTDQDEKNFLDQWKIKHEEYNLPKNPKKVLDFYDYKSAFKSGVPPIYNPGINVYTWPLEYKRIIPKKIEKYAEAAKDFKIDASLKELEQANKEKEPESISMKDMAAQLELDKLSVFDSKFWARLAEQFGRGVLGGVKSQYKFLAYRELAKDPDRPLEISGADVKGQMLLRKYIQDFHRINNRPPTNTEFNVIKRIYHSNISNMKLEHFEEMLKLLPEMLPGSTGLFEDIVVGMSSFAVVMGMTAVNPAAGTFMAITQIAGETAERLVKQGIPVQQAMEAAMTLGVIQGITESAGNIIQIKSLTALIGKVYGKNPLTGRLLAYFQTMALTSVAEGLEEGLQGAEEIVFNYVMANPDLPPEDLIKFLATNKKALLKKHGMDLLEQAGVGAGGGALLAFLIGGGKMTTDYKAILEDYRIGPRKKALKEQAKTIRMERLFGEVKPSAVLRPDIAYAETRRREILKKAVEEKKITQKRAEEILKTLTPLETEEIREGLLPAKEGIKPLEGPELEQYFKKTEKSSAQLSIEFPDKIKSAAIKVGNKIYTGQSHIQIIMENDLDTEDLSQEQSGFINPEGKFLTRREAAEAVGFVKPMLISEDLGPKVQLEIALSKEVALPEESKIRELVFHQTPEATTLQTTELGAVFSSSEKIAEQIPSAKKVIEKGSFKDTEGQEVVPAYLDLRNPIEMKQANWEDLESVYNSLPLDVKKVFPEEFLDKGDLEMLKKALTRLGYDGIKFSLPGEQKFGYIAFDEKSVIRPYEEQASLMAAAKLPEFNTLREAAIAGLKASAKQITQVKEEITSLEAWSKGLKGKRLIEAETEIAMYEEFLKVATDKTRYKKDLEAVGEKIEEIPKETKEELKKRIAKITAGLEKKGVGVGRGRHSKNFLISVGKTAGTIYGLAKPTDEKITRIKIHKLYGEMEITEYFRTIDGIRYKILNSPILPKTQKTRDELIDKLLKDYEFEQNWYEAWIQWIKAFKTANISDELITKYIKFLGILSKQASPAGAQTMFGNVVKQLEENGKVRAGKGKGLDTDSKKKIEAVWYGKDTDIKTLAEFQAYYGPKIGAMVFTSLDPRTTEEYSVVIDRHMPRLWGYNIMWSPEGATAFSVTKDLRREIVKDIARAATRNNIPIAGVQSALWYAIGAGHTGTATHFDEAAAVSPKESLGRRMFTATTLEPQQIVHWGPTFFYTVRGAAAPERLSAADNNRIQDLTNKLNSNQKTMFGALSEEESQELQELRHRQEGEKPNPWSKNDVVKRMEGATEHIRYMPLGYWYAGGVRKESYFSGMEPHLTSIYEDEIYDANKDLLGYRKKALELIKNDPMFKKGARTAEQLYTNALAFLIWKNKSYKGYSFNVNGEPWVFTFDETPVEQKGERVEIAVSDKVSRAVTLPTDFYDLVQVSQPLLKSLRTFVNKAAENQAVTNVEISSVLSNFEGISEHAVSISAKGPMDAVKALASEMGLQKNQDVVFIFNDKTGIPGTMVDFAISIDLATDQKTNLGVLEKAIRDTGIVDFTIYIPSSGGLPRIRFFIENNSEQKNDLTDRFVELYNKIGVKDSIKHQPVKLEIVGEFGGGEAALTNYKSHLTKHMGDTRGSELYEKAYLEGVEWTANAPQQFATVLAKVGLYEKYANQQPGSFIEDDPQGQTDLQIALEKSSIKDLTKNRVRTVEHALKIVNKALLRFKWPQEIKNRLQLILSEEVVFGNLTPAELLEFFDTFKAHDVTLEEVKRKGIAGLYRSNTKLTSSVIAVSYLGIKDWKVEEAVYHEMWHFLEELLIPVEVLKQIKLLEPNKETRAKLFATFMLNPASKEFTKKPHWWQTAWMRIRNFLKSVSQDLQKENYTSLESIFGTTLMGAFSPKTINAKGKIESVEYVAPPLPVTTGTLSYGDIKTHLINRASLSTQSETDGDTLTKRYINEIPNAIELPELLDLVVDILDGKYPQIKTKFTKKGSLGIFIPGREVIQLKADIFKDPKLASEVLGHEIGHVIDWLPEKSFTRGNILGRIASLKDYMKKTLPLEPGAPGELTEKDRMRLRLEAAKLIKAASKKVEWVDEFITKEMPITPDTVLDIWNSIEDARLLNPNLYDFIARLNSYEKKLIVKSALKGVVTSELKQFAKVIKEPTGKQIPVKIVLTEADIKKKYADLINKEIKKRRLWSASEVTNELKIITRIWRPFQPHADPKYTAYRYHSNELYADAISVLLNDPRLLKQEAPKFYEAFFRYMESKPEIYKIYNEIQDNIKSGKVHKDRVEKMYQMFREGNDLYSADINAEKDPLKDKLKRDFIDSFHDIIKDIKIVGEKNVDPQVNPRYQIENLAYTGSEIEMYLTEMNHKVLRFLKKANLDWDREFGLMVFLKRVALERSLLANPGGWNKELALEKIKALESVELSERQRENLNTALVNFRLLHEKFFINRAEAAEVFDNKMIELFRDRDAYATFDVQPYLAERYGRSVGMKIYQQIGTFQKIVNPATATMMKDIGFIKAVNRNKAIRSVVKFYLQYKSEFGFQIEEATTKWNGKFHEIQESTDSTKGLLTYLHKGKAYGYYVPKEVAKSFDINPWAGTGIAKILSWTAKPFRMVFTELNYGFWIVNAFFRDYQRAIMALPKANIINFTKHYIKGIRPAFKSVFGVPDTVIQEMQAGNMLISIADFRGMTSEDAQLERLLRHYHMQPGKYITNIKKPWGQFFNYMGNAFKQGEFYMTGAGRALERTTKVAGYTYMKEKFPDLNKEVISHIIRTRAGSPDFLRLGRAHSIYNNILLFSNAMKEGYRGDMEAWADNPTEFMTKKVLYTFMPKLLMWAMASGLLGLGLKGLFRNVSEYDLTNYIIIPLGTTKSGKSVYFRVPTDETSRLVGGIFWKMLNHKELGGMDFQTGLFDYTAGQVPSMGPFWSVLSDTVNYASGDNPYNEFYGRHALDDQTMIAGGMRAHTQMAKYLFNQMGGSILYKFPYDDVDRIAEEMETLFGFPIKSPVADFVIKLPEEPVASNILGRFIKVSDYGIREELKRGKRILRKQNMNDVLDAKDAIVKLLNRETLDDKDVIAMLKKPDIIERNLMVGLSKQYGMVYLEEYMTATSQAEKAYVLLQLIKDNAVPPTVYKSPQSGVRMQSLGQGKTEISKEYTIYEKMKKEGF